MDVTETNRPALLENDLDAKIENSKFEDVTPLHGTGVTSMLPAIGKVGLVALTLG